MLNYAEPARDQALAPELQALLHTDSSLVLRDEKFGEISVLCDVATGTRRPLVPKNWRKRVFDMVHGLSHAGPRPTIKAVAGRFVWAEFKKDIQSWCRTCEDCQKSKVSTHIQAPLARRDPPDRRFGSLHINLVGPLPESKGMRYLLTIVDRFSRWIEAIPQPDIMADTCIQSFLLNWVARSLSLIHI